MTKITSTILGLTLTLAAASVSFAAQGTQSAPAPAATSAGNATSTTQKQHVKKHNKKAVNTRNQRRSFQALLRRATSTPGSGRHAGESSNSNLIRSVPAHGHRRGAPFKGAPLAGFSSLFLYDEMDRSMPKPTVIRQSRPILLAGFGGLLF